jgi:hypothetical protein
MDPELAEIEDREERIKRIRSRLYWDSATVATIVVLMFSYTMMMVPGMYTREKLWMLAIEIGLLTVPFGIRIWEVRTSEATFVGGLRGFMGLFLILELVWCIIGVFELAAMK